MKMTNVILVNGKNPDMNKVAEATKKYNTTTIVFTGVAKTKASKLVGDKSPSWHCHHRLETHNSDGEKNVGKDCCTSTDTFGGTEMTEEDDNLDKVLEYTAKAIQCRMDAEQYDKGTLEKYALEATAQVYDEMTRKEAQKWNSLD